MPLAQTLQDFRDSVQNCLTYIQVGFGTDSSGAYLYSEDVRLFISESSFLKIFISWESFLEDSFIKYLQGTPSINGVHPIKYASPTSIDHAQKIVIGTQKYVDWSNPEIVRKLASIFFDTGYVFNTHISSINAELMDLRTIRNAAAHLSSTTSQKLDSLSTRLLRRHCVNIKVGELIFEINPDTNNTLLDDFLSLLDIAAENIANG